VQLPARDCMILTTAPAGRVPRVPLGISMTSQARLSVIGSGEQGSMEIWWPISHSIPANAAAPSVPKPKYKAVRSRVPFPPQNRVNPRLAPHEKSATHISRETRELPTLHHGRHLNKETYSIEILRKSLKSLSILFVPSTTQHSGSSAMQTGSPVSSRIPLSRRHLPRARRRGR
jgi:hypothetical protein